VNGFHGDPTVKRASCRQLGEVVKEILVAAPAQLGFIGGKVARLVLVSINTR